MGLFRQRARKGPHLMVRAFFLSQIPLRNWEQDPAHRYTGSRRCARGVLFNSSRVAYRFRVTLVFYRKHVLWEFNRFLPERLARRDFGQKVVAISLRRKSRVTRLDSMSLRNVLSSPWVGRRPMANSEPREWGCERYRDFTSIGLRDVTNSPIFIDLRYS
jgi:hypothetical protein